jgi:hypothetical protein
MSFAGSGEGAEAVTGANCGVGGATETEIPAACQRPDSPGHPTMPRQCRYRTRISQLTPDREQNRIQLARALGEREVRPIRGC